MLHVNVLLIRAITKKVFATDSTSLHYHESLDNRYPKEGAVKLSLIWGMKVSDDNNYICIQVGQFGN